MDILFIIASSAYLLWITRNILFWVSLWQLKEYRFDRMLIHLKETGQGRELLFSPLSILKIVLIVGYVFVVFNDDLTVPYQFAIVGLYLFQALLVLRENFSNLAKKPVFTAKAIFLIITAFLITLLLFAFPLLDKYLWLLLIDKVLTIIIGIVVLVLAFPTEIHRDIQIEKAVKKLKERKDLLVIGVTGSYGKSSTKDYLAQILATRFPTLKTHGTNNTPIGIAKTILDQLDKTIKIFVVEMGAYKRGEISSMCKIVHPKIGILTAVNDQHLSLFKTIENTKKAKYELIDSLPKNGLALFNGNNQITEAMFTRTKKPKVLYTTNTASQKTDQKQSKIIKAYNIEVKKNELIFDVDIDEETLHLRTPLLGAHNIENILPGVYLAKHLGMKTKQIQDAVAGLKSLPKTMIRYVLSNGVTIVDDTFNANPEAVVAALSYIKIYSKKRILVLQPMIELGKRAKDEHYRVAKEISKTCDHLFLTNGNFYSAVMRGIHDGKGKCIVEVGNANTIAEYLQNHTKKDDVIAFEGKEAAYVMDKVLEK